jgi:hypothetical protein
MWLRRSLSSSFSASRLSRALTALTIREPASYYYRVMTRSEWMPVLIGERF